MYARCNSHKDEDEDKAYFCEYLSDAIYNESNILILSDLL